MFIKKHKNKNEYVSSGDFWVRNFAKEKVKPIDINTIVKSNDFNCLIQNELTNDTGNYPPIDIEELVFSKIVIMSDGFDFENKQELLYELPQDIMIIATNKALSKWKPNKFKNINVYFVNNPYPNCMSFLPGHKYYPTCVFSSRTYPEFVKKYLGRKYEYIATPLSYFSSNRKCVNWYLDDYRNPICGAIGFAYRLGVEKLLLLCCDDSFSESRSGSIKLDNGLYTYPNQLICDKLIDANLFWLKNVEIKNHSSGTNLINSTYIKEEEIKEFFNG